VLTKVPLMAPVGILANNKTDINISRFREIITDHSYRIPQFHLATCVQIYFLCMLISSGIHSGGRNKAHDQAVFIRNVESVPYLLTLAFILIVWHVMLKQNFKECAPYYRTQNYQYHSLNFIWNNEMKISGSPKSAFIKNIWEVL
jgi:hypothetical protein